MNPREKVLAGVAGVLLAVSVFSTFAAPIVCLASASSGLALALYLRHRGAFLSDNAPLAGAVLIGGSAMMVLGGILLVNARAGFILMGVILVPILLFLVVFGLRERLRAYLSRFEPEAPKKPAGKIPSWRGPAAPPKVGRQDR